LTSNSYSLDPFRHPVGRLILGVLGAAYLAWSIIFIYQSSYIALDGHRYFALFDDAMISMRYGWNLAHGLGLVWNAGQRVEGYSNLLMTLWMSLASFLFDKRFAVLAVQVSGIPVVLVAAYLGMRVAGQHTRGRALRVGVMTGVVVCALFYYPLSYWTLMGMETGAVTLLVLLCTWFGLRWEEEQRTSDVVSLAVCSGLAFLARSDSLLLSGTVFVYLAVVSFKADNTRSRLTRLAQAGLIVVAFVVAQIAFRELYYGTLLPNTYTLKLTRFPIRVRLIGGTRFVLEFLGQVWLALVLAIVELVFFFQRRAALLAGICAVAVAYQVYVGGDPWPSWRMLTPAMPAVFVLACSGAASLVSAWKPISQNGTLRAAGMILLVGGALGLADLPFASDLIVSGPTSAAIANRVNTNSAIAVDSLTDPTATIGVIWAGTLPYYADRAAVDFLGKSDPYIASLDADVTGSVSWSGMISVPGHNKYNLDYSIVRLRPTYIQGFSWGYATVKPFAMQNYVRVEYHGAAGTKTIFLLKDSPLVCWAACKGRYTINPWPGQG
jgi:hypothetical protein